MAKVLDSFVAVVIPTTATQLATQSPQKAPTGTALVQPNQLIGLRKNVEASNGVFSDFVPSLDTILKDVPVALYTVQSLHEKAYIWGKYMSYVNNFTL